ncbi:acetylornithine deacetylase [Thioalkalivibrio sp. XN8]|uniref:acetylornithine deacetylase n=1 Tax=Thioalkalivibrio sp. XN8 TaxID=2712863 RepID=UPI0013ECC2B2|nr:acetylornithine deacetylase [Thioalkalivibrio sp. XN8]NGP52025.1 acetylornithine deacetylase [Thioalkalivibrio sp. XN8]
MSKTLPNLQDMMRRLVATPSVSSLQAAHDQSNRAVSELLADWLEPLGFEVGLMPVPGLEGKYNLVARSGPGEDGLVLSGHTDTVPYDAARWTRDPFAGEVHNGRLYGLGSADMKSFLACAAHAAARINLEKLGRPLVIVGTADEESGMGGAKALVAEGEPLGARAVIGEPTRLRPVNRHKGVLLERIRIEGRSGHASDPAAGLNAIDGAMAAIGALHAFIDGRAEEFPAAHFPVPGPTLNIGAIRGGDNPNRICASCELDVDLRLVPGMRCDSLRRDLRAAVARALEGSGFELSFTVLFDGLDPLAPGAEKALAQACEHASGHSCGAVNFGTEGPLFQQLDMEVVICGPGDIAVAHQPDESISVAEAYRAVDVLEQLVRQFCSQAA